MTTKLHDAIIVGAGAAGGLATTLLCEQGLSVLVLDAGGAYSFWQKPFRKTFAAAASKLADPRLAKRLPPSLIHAGSKAMTRLGRFRQPVQTECFAWVQKPDSLVDDRDFPYETPPGKPFNWIRSHGVGGRMVVPGHGRQYYRLGEYDLAGKQGQPSPWPFGPEELAPWYDLVERRLGLSGACEGIGFIPDSLIRTPIAPNATEEALSAILRQAWPNLQVMLSRYAPPADFMGDAERSGRLTLRGHALVQSILSGPDGRARGAEWVDARTGQRETAEAPLVFLCASALESTRILLNSGNGKGPLGAQLPALGRYLTDHVMVKAEALRPPLPAASDPEPGRCLYLPRFDLRSGGDPLSLGFGVQLYTTPNPSGAWMTAVAFGEMAPSEASRVTLSRTRTGKWGTPALQIDMKWGQQEHALAGSMSAALKCLMKTADARLLVSPDAPAVPGTSVHECGGARLGTDPETSVLDPGNECWAMPGLFVTDGASLPSQGIQNPTLTIMALTARACARATGSQPREKTCPGNFEISAGGKESVGPGP